MLRTIHEVRGTAGMTHIGEYLALNIHSELGKAPGSDGTYDEGPVALAVSENRHRGCNRDAPNDYAQLFRCIVICDEVVVNWNTTSETGSDRNIIKRQLLPT